MAEEYDLVFVETSAMANVNVEEAFVGLARQVKSRLQAEGSEFLNSTGGNTVKVTAKSSDASYLSCCYSGPPKKPTRK